MLDGLNESELLALIEGDLPVEAASDLRRRLRAFPEVLGLIDRMQADRAVLAHAPEPRLTGDLVEELEPMMARAMLLDDSVADQAPAPSTTTAGVYRARHNRAVRIRQVSRALIAAGFMVLVGGGALIAANMLLTGPDISDTGTAGTQQQAPEQGQLANAGTPDNRQVESAGPTGPIHHWDAVPVDASLARVDGGRPDRLRPDLRLRSGAPAMESGFALEIRADQQTAVLARLSEMVADMEQAALVRNFTYEEAAAGFEQMLASSQVADPDRLRTAMASRNHGRPLTREQRRVINRVVRGTSIELGEHLAGLKATAPPAEQQLAYVEAGANHSMTLPAEFLLPLLETLAEEFGPDIALSRLVATESDDETAPAPALISSWERWLLWREAIESFDFVEGDAHGGAGLMVVLPIRASKPN